MRAKKKESVFEERISKRIDELKWLYMELYRDEHAFGYFLDMLRRMYDERSAGLRKWDLEHGAGDRDYVSGDTLGMLMYADRFADSLKGVNEHLDYIEECGVNYLHLMPLLESPEGKNDGGYAVSDFRKVQPELGSMEDLTGLTEDCHERGIRVCLDLVMNHTSDEHEWARRAKAGEKEFQDRFFFYDDWSIPQRYEETVPEVFPQTAPGNFTWCPEAGKVVMTCFYPYQWDLNYHNPTVFNDMTENMLFLCNRGVDVIRLDAVPYIWKEVGTSCRNLPQVHTLVRMMRLAAEVVCPGTVLLGEVVMEPAKVVPYFGTIEKPECHMLYNVTTMASTWHTVATRDVRLLKHQLGTVFALPKQYVFLNYLRCHDDIGWGLDYGFLEQFGFEEVAHKKFLNDYLKGSYHGSDSRGELYNDDPRLGDARLCGTTASLCGIEAAEFEGSEEKLARAISLDLMLHAFLFTQSGIPVLYSGDETGQKNDYSYHEDPLRCADSRYLHRGKLDWDSVERRRDRKSREGRIFCGIRELAHIRSTHPVFDVDADAWIVECHNDHVLGIGRYYRGEKLIALFNFSEWDQPAWIGEEGIYRDLISGRKRSVESLVLPAYGFLWLITGRAAEEREGTDK